MGDVNTLDACPFVSSFFPLFFLFFSSFFPLFPSFSLFYPLEVFRQFRGREPSPKALLKQTGLA